MIDLPLLFISLLAFWSPGPAEMMLLLVVALLLYGGNLPDIARSWGKTFAEFRRNLNGIQHEINDVIYSEPEQLEYRDDSYPSEDYGLANDFETDSYETNENDNNASTVQSGIVDSGGGSDGGDDETDQQSSDDLDLPRTEQDA